MFSTIKSARKIKTSLAVGLATAASAALLTGCGSEDAPTSNSKSEATPHATVETTAAGDTTTSETPTSTAPDDSEISQEIVASLKEGDVVQVPKHAEWGQGTVQREPISSTAETINVGFTHVPIEEFTFEFDRGRGQRLCAEAEPRDADGANRIDPVDGAAWEPFIVACTSDNEGSKDELQAELDGELNELRAEGYLSMTFSVRGSDLEKVN